jgi:hypothetical protein
MRTQGGARATSERAFADLQLSEKPEKWAHSAVAAAYPRTDARDV